MRSHCLFKVGEPRKPRPPRENKQNPSVDPRLIVWNGGQGRDDHLNLHTLCVCTCVCVRETERENLVEFEKLSGSEEPGLHCSFASHCTGNKEKRNWQMPVLPSQVSLPGPLGTQTPEPQDSQYMGYRGMESIGASIRKGSLENVTLS